MERQLKTLNTIMKTCPAMRCLLQSIRSLEKKSFFTPFFYDDASKKWIGAVRWYGRNNQSISTGSRLANEKIWTIIKSRIPILPKSHKTRKELIQMAKCRGINLYL